jgi:hypothetical protein
VAGELPIRGDHHEGEYSSRLDCLDNTNDHDLHRPKEHCWLACLRVQIGIQMYWTGYITHFGMKRRGFSFPRSTKLSSPRS